MTHAQAIKIAQGAIAAEIKRLAPLANMAEPPPGLPANPTPAAANAAKRRRQLREASVTLTQQTMELV